jgi:RND family efflux transporter MFP subunit
MTVNVISPTPMTFDRAIAATGTVTARDELIIGSDAAGVRLVEVLVDVGSFVQKGQLLARGDDAQLRAQLAQQDALVKQARIELSLAQGNLERAEQLQKAGFYSTEAVHTRQSAAATAAAKVEVARAQRHELEVQIAHTRVVAPANGVIAKKAATVGAVVQPGVESMSTCPAARPPLATRSKASVPWAARKASKRCVPCRSPCATGAPSDCPISAPWTMRSRIRRRLRS